MNSYFNKPCSLFDHLIEDKNLKFKQSQSGEYIQLNAIAELDRLYDYVLVNMKKVKVKFQANQDVYYHSETQFGKVKYIKMVLEYFFNKFDSKRPISEDNNQITCQDCKNYQQSLQKLEGDIRQHIRLQQQLKLYQQSLQQKIQQLKKQNEKSSDKLAKFKSTVEDFKSKQNNWVQKLMKLEEQNERFKQENIKNKSGLIADHSARALRETSHTKSIRALNEVKQNIFTHKNTCRKEEKKQPRKSMEKRPQSSQRWRQVSHTNSNKQFPLSQKLIMQKNKQQKRKAIQAKFQMRR